MIRIVCVLFIVVFSTCVQLSHEDIDPLLPDVKIPWAAYKRDSLTAISPSGQMCFPCEYVRSTVFTHYDITQLAQASLC